MTAPFRPRRYTLPEKEAPSPIAPPRPLTPMEALAALADEKIRRFEHAEQARTDAHARLWLAIVGIILGFSIAMLF